MSEPAFAAACALPRRAGCGARRAPRRPCVRMLRVQTRRRAEAWGGRPAGLTGRFLPMDPRDEAILDELARRDGAELPPPVDAHATAADRAFGAMVPDGGLSADRGGGAAEEEGDGKWSRRSAAAKKRWADPEYRANMLRKRAEKRERDIAAGFGRKPRQKRGRRVEIGRMDSITLSSEEKAKEINDYAQSNQRRSEKITKFHRDSATWMESRLQDGEGLRSRSSVDFKRQRQEMRRAAARERHAKMRAGAGAPLVRKGDEPVEAVAPAGE